MSDIVDDLLEEVEQLEESTQALESTVKDTSNQNQKAQEANQKASNDASLIALEAAKTAQEASTQSHQAAQSSIKQAELLKAQTIELTDSNFNWRQAVRNASKDFQAAKGSFSIMLITSIVFSLIVLGVMGYLFYAMQKEQAQFKGEVLDIIATENTLLNKKITLKVDELASVIESMTFQVSKLNKAEANTRVNIHPTEPGMLEENTENKPIDNKEHSQSQHKQAEMHPLPKHETTLHKPTHTEKTHIVKDGHAETAPSHQNTSIDTHNSHSSHDSQPKHEVPSDGLHKTQSSHETSAQVSSHDFSELKALVEKIITKQNSLQSQVKQSSKTVSSGLTPAQVKKLNGISWLVRKQEKTLKEIQTRLGLKTPNTKQGTTNNSIINELKTLQQQQAQLQQNITKMQKAIKTYNETPAPYSYKAK
ncbi:hypothetical protein [Thiomicrorhabdus sp. Milos-T2]|uniref:hypothetical protein n=1 Tax=Thiomicrorhabdus sp. Milos-T2 TaxID=90814 RepID=UPI000571C8E3|nr:hypothetical protein [Thiomicrorhabdus sp. Milos-T2]